MRIFKKKRRKVDTSIEGYKKYGIKITQEQLGELAVINACMKLGHYDDVPVHPIVLALHVFGLIPSTEMDNNGGNDSNNDSSDNSNNPLE